MARDFLGNIRGPQGPKGDDGDRGPQGPKGDKGDTGESETPYIVDSGELIDDTGSHFYEVYKNGFGNAWGFHILRGVDFESPLGEFHRARSPYDIDGLLNFDENTVSVNISLDNRTNNYNIGLMTTVNSRGPYSIRLMNFNPSTVTDVDIYVSYNYKGIVI